MTLREISICASNSGYAIAFSRHDLPEVCIRRPSKTEGAGNAGCALHPAVSCAKSCVKNTHTSIQGSGEHPTFPAQWLYGLYALAPEIWLYCLRRLAGTWYVGPVGLSAPPHDMTPTLRLSGPHDFAVRFSAVRPARRCPLTENRPANTLRARHRRVHRIPSQRSVTMANAPPPGQDGGSCKVICPTG